MHPYMGATNPYSSPGVPLPYEYYMSRGVTHDTYNQLVKPPPLRLGQETPDCSKVIFNAGRTPFGRIIPKAKKKRKNSRLLRRPQFAEKKGRGNIPCESDCCKTEPPDGAPHSQSAKIRNWFSSQESDDDKMSISSQLKIIEVELDEDDIPGFMEDIRRYESNLIMDKANYPFTQERNNSSNDIDEEGRTSSESDPVSCQLSEKIDNFLDYYKLICGKKKKLPSSLVKELIIKLMYNKIYLLTHVEIGSSNDFVPESAVERQLEDKILSKGQSPRGTNGLNESKIGKDFLTTKNLSDEGQIKLPTRNSCDFAVYDKPYHSAIIGSDSDENFDTENESDAENYNGRGHQIGPPAPPGGGRYFTAAGTSGWFSTDSPVLSHPFSRAVQSYRCGGSAVSDTVLDHAHECDDTCAMPCKASGIPVYQGRSGQVRGVGQKNAASSSPVRSKILNTNQSSKSRSVVSINDNNDSVNYSSFGKRKDTNSPKPPLSINKNYTKLNSKPPASPSVNKLSRIPNRSGFKENGSDGSKRCPNGRTENWTDDPRRRKTDTPPLSINQPKNNYSSDDLLKQSTKNHDRKYTIRNMSQKYNSNSSLCPSSGDEYSSCKELRSTSSETKINGLNSRLTPSPNCRTRVSSLERNRGSIVSRIMAADHVDKSNCRSSSSKSSYGGSHSPVFKERRERRTDSDHSTGDRDSSTRNSTPTSSDDQSPIIHSRIKNQSMNEKTRSIQRLTSTRVLTSEKRGEMNNNITTRIRKENSSNAKQNCFSSRSTTAADSTIPTKRNKQNNPTTKRTVGPSPGHSENNNKGRRQKCISSSNLTEKKDLPAVTCKSANSLVLKDAEFKVSDSKSGSNTCSSPDVAKIHDDEHCNESEKESALHNYSLNQKPESECNNAGVARYQQGEARSPKLENYMFHDCVGSAESSNHHENEGRNTEEHKNLKNSQSDSERNNCERPSIKDFDKAKLSKIIDASLLENLKINGEILGDQFDAIITTLKKVAESMDCITEGEQEFHTLPRGFFEKQNRIRNNRISQMNRSFSAPNYAVENDVTSRNRRPFSFCDFVHPKIDNNTFHENNINRSKILNNERIDAKNRLFPATKTFCDKIDLKNSLTKSRELLHHLENEYKLLKGEEVFIEQNNKSPSLQQEAKSLAKRFNNILEPYHQLNEGQILSSNPKHTTNNDENLKDCSRPGHNFFPFIKNRCHSLSLPNGDKGPGYVPFAPQRTTYKDLTLFHMGIPQSNNNSSKSGGSTISGVVPEEFGNGSPLTNGKSNLNDSEVIDSEEEEKNLQRSLSLPKSFLSDKYGLNGLRTALTSVTFPWRREHLGFNENNTLHFEGSLQEENSLENDPIDKECYPEDVFNEFPSTEISAEENVLEQQKQRRNSSFSRSSISHSEWDIRRPWSTADADGSILSQSTCRLAGMTSDHVSSEPQARNDEILSIPYQSHSSIQYQNSHEGMFQKFKKSLSLRLNKKSSRSESPGIEKSLSSLPMEVPLTSEDFQSSLVTSPRCQIKDEESKSNYFKFGHPIFRSSKERRRAKLKDVRSSKCNSGDSGDSGIEVISGTSTLVGGELSPSIFQEDASPPIINYLGNNNISNGEPQDSPNEMGVRRTQSDMSNNKQPTKHLSCGDFVYRQTLGRQYSSPQPIKLRPHHRLPNYNSVTTVQTNQRLRRSRASTHLRRSVSQPLDLDKSFQAQVSLHKMRTTDDEPPTERLRRPSVDNLLSEENTSEEEGGMSDCEEMKPDLKFYMDEDDEMIVYAEALWDHVSLDSDELVFKAGDLITVVDSSDKDWWWGRIPPRSGWFPASFVRLLVNQEDHQTKSDDTDDPGIWNDRQLSISSLSQDEIRSNVINEILSTERDYVKHLKDVVEGYLKQVRKRPDMFCEESISTIFGNMEALFSFHTEFLTQLEMCIDFQEPHQTCIGDCFIRNKLRFEIYSEYCNNHPLAVFELQQLYQYQKYVHFFEACRLLQEMIDISLDGFLLTPVQKICKYPLQLQELLKYTQPSHRDYSSVHGAMQAMKEVALLVNERRRRMECLEKIATWQKSVEGWEGLDLLEDSSQLIHQGEVTKGVNTSWPKEVTLFLFDHQIVYCKKDLLKRNTFVYRGRINTDLCEVFAIPFDPTRSAALQNAWKIHCLHKNKTYVFSCKTPAEKIKWLNAFKKERELVAVDEASGFVASERQKQVARLAARNQKNKPKKPKTVKSHKRTQIMTYAQAHLLVNNDGEIRSNSLPLRSAQESKKKGLWFSFGGHKKSRSSQNSKQNSILND